MFMENLFNQYRERHDIPSPAELKGLRKKYGLSAHTMSKIMLRSGMLSFHTWSLRNTVYEEIFILSLKR